MLTITLIDVKLKAVLVLIQYPLAFKPHSYKEPKQS